MDRALKQWLTERKRGKKGNTKIWTSRERKEIFRWNKKHHSYFFERLSFGENQNFLKKIAYKSFKHCGDNYNYQTHASTKRILDTLLYKKNTYGIHSAKYHCILDWNQFKRIFANLSETDYTYSKLRSLIKQYFSNKY